MKINLKKVISLLMIFCIFIGVVSCGESEANVEVNDKYHTGTIESGKDIYDYFECTGKANVVGLAGMNGITAVSYQQMTNGGWVAWTSNRYVYTDENVGEDAIRNAAFSRIVNVKAMNF